MVAALKQVDTCLDRLVAALGPGKVMAGGAVPPRNTNDWSILSATRPLAVVMPTTTAEVAAIMAICHETRTPVVPQGGLTGLCGGARAGDNQIALSLEKMTGIEEIDAASATMTVKAGTPLELVQKAADEAGFFCALDLGARGSCAIGGNLSTNAGGNRVIRYGMAREMVLGLEAVLPDGTVWTSLNKMLKNNAGFDLKHLFIGSEGTLGVITRIVLRLFPKSRSTQAALIGLADYAGVEKLLQAARSGLGPVLSAFEVMWPDYWEVATRRVPNVRDPLTGAHGFYVLVEAMGTDEARDQAHFESWLEGLFENGVIADAAMSRSLADVKAFWGVRDACAEFVRVLGPHASFDIGLPVAAMDVYAKACRERMQRELPGCFALFYGHIGDGNMHIVAGLPGADPQPKDVIEEIVYSLVKAHGGTVSAEHGIGTLKKKWLAHARSPQEIALMQTIKQAMDPYNILNPGKVVDPA